MIQNNIVIDGISEGDPLITPVYNEDEKVIFMKPGRSATSSIFYSVLRGNGYSVCNPDDCEWIENITDEEIKNDYFVFTVVRNPFDRLVSCYNAFMTLDLNGVGRVSFEEFVMGRGLSHILYEDNTFTNEHWMPLHYYYELSPNERYVDFVLMVENLDEDWKKLSEKIDVPDTIPHTHVNSYPHNNYREYYDDALIEEVSRIYKRDLELFDYEF
jgi:hypothetical protein